MPTNNYKELFSLRMRREGKHPEFKKRVKFLQSEGQNYSQAFTTAMTEMGFNGIEEERQLLEEYETRLRAADEKKAKADRLAENRKKRQVSKLEQAHAALPESASTDAELQWIRAHPIWMRQAGSDEDQVQVTVEDIEGAPSKGAACELVIALASPEKWHDKLLGQRAKTLGMEGEKDVSSTGAVEDRGIDDLKRMLGGV